MHEERYQTGALLGRGGMAEVFSGIDCHLRRPVAIKRLREDRALNPTLRARFRREATAAARLNHPGIVAVLDTAEVMPSTGTTPIPIIVMELVDGSSLRELLREGPRLTPDRAFEITDAVLRALTASHTAGIVHRDIKPANVLLTSAGEVKVADFGIARTVSDDSATQTQTQTVMGSPHYMSPEQARGMTVDHRSDLYSVGCLLYELLVGTPPFTGDSPLSITYQHVTEAPARPSTLDPELAGDVDTIVLRALEKAPGDRYQTAEQMRADIGHLRSGQPLVLAAADRAADAHRGRDDGPPRTGRRARPDPPDPRHPPEPRHPPAGRRARRGIPVDHRVHGIRLPPVAQPGGSGHHRGSGRPRLQSGSGREHAPQRPSRATHRTRERTERDHPHGHRAVPGRRPSRPPPTAP